MQFLNFSKKCCKVLLIFSILGAVIVSTSTSTYGLATSETWGYLSVRVDGIGIGVRGSTSSSSNFDGWNEDYSTFSDSFSYTASEGDGYFSGEYLSVEYFGYLGLQTTRIGEYAEGFVQPYLECSLFAPGGYEYQYSISDIGQHYEFHGSGIDSNYIWLPLMAGESLSVVATVITYSATYSPPVPEPASMLLLGSGLIGLAAYGRKRFL